MNIGDMTINQVRELHALVGGNAAKPCPFESGRCYLIRTVTHYWLGRVERIVGDFMVLRDASWIANTGRYHKAVSIENLEEVEPVGTAYVGLGAIVDAKDWTGDLPSVAK